MDARIVSVRSVYFLLLIGVAALRVSSAPVSGKETVGKNRIFVEKRYFS